VVLLWNMNVSIRLPCILIVIQGHHLPVRESVIHGVDPAGLSIRESRVSVHMFAFMR